MNGAGSGVLGPGVVLGTYPERQTPAVPLPGGAWLTRLRAMRGQHGDFAARVRQLKDGLHGMTPEGAPWQDSILRLRMRLTREGLGGDALIEALAHVTLACEHALGVTPFDTQLIAARIMLANQLAEMATGEGKTLAAALAAAAAAWAGAPVHVVTANDYLVERDCAFLTPLYRMLGLTAGAVAQHHDIDARRRAYACDIVYCTAKELAFDYLRDGLLAPRGSVLEQSAAALGALGTSAAARQAPLLRGLNIALIDEADSVLIDEARVPLILSRPSSAVVGACLAVAWRLSLRLQAEHFAIDSVARSVNLTPAGHAALAIADAADADDTTAGGTPWLNTAHRRDLVTLALCARHVLRQGRDYVVDGGRVHIVDETTGRRAEGRAWSQGLQQMVEFAAGCEPSTPLETVAQITFQRFFRRYLRLGGMSGTLAEARTEFYKLYGLAVTPVAPRRVSRRVALPPRAFADTSAQWEAVVARVREMQAAGRPVLIGTDSVAASEALSRRLTVGGISHAVLNALQDKGEAEAVARAGKAGVVTVATQLAGRGTDILLDTASRAAGGLHVICCQQNGERRVDRQLIGRCARQGDPGSFELLIAWDGPLLRENSGNGRGSGKKSRTAGDWASRMMAMGATRALARAQRAAARRHRQQREALLRRDEQINDMLAFGGIGQ